MANVLSTRQFQRDYSLSRKIGHGAFGEIYIGKSVRTGKPVAVKKEPINTKFPQLLYEAKVYSILEGGMGIPRVYMKGSMGDNNIMVMDLLGPSLEDLFNYCGRRFTLKTAMMLGIELITRLEFIHHRNFIHRDIKPDNFVIGIGERANVVYIIDFGLSKQYRDPYHRKHIPYRENKNLTGTPRYASLSNHLGIEQSRRDDLESLGYVLLYFIRGKLPWQGLNAQTKKQKYNKIMESKIENSFASLCEGLPPQLLDYMNYCRNLVFDEKPNYQYLRSLFRSVLATHHLANDGRYDWMDASIPKNPSHLPEHARGSDGGLRQDLLVPASVLYRESYKEELYRKPVRQQSLQSLQSLQSMQNAQGAFLQYAPGYAVKREGDGIIPNQEVIPVVYNRSLKRENSGYLMASLDKRR